MDLGLNIEKITVITDFFRIFFIEIFTFLIFLKISNQKFKFNIKEINWCIYFLINDIIISFIKYEISYTMSIISLIFLLSIIFSYKTNNKLGYTIILTIISLSINYVIFLICIVINFVINIVCNIKSDYINLGIIVIIQSFLIYRLFKVKKIKNGISFLIPNSNNGYLYVSIVNISIIIAFSFFILSNHQVNIFNTMSIFVYFVIFSTIMFITIKESIQVYYKQKLMIKELEETKKELEEKNKEIEKLENENLEFSKKSHSIAHKQKALEYQMNKLLNKVTEEERGKIKKQLENISQDLCDKVEKVELEKTGIEEIDNMLELMQAECIKYNIEFNLQLKGNIYQMINNYITKEDLEILLADHIKDAIIAINHSDNINKSILVRLGKIDECFALYIYDSGIEFEKETLENLGKKPVTTHKDEGGTGMGFMNTFDTLKKCNASLIINQIGKPSPDNYTKAIIIKFNNKKEFKIN